MARAAIPVTQAVPTGVAAPATTAGDATEHNFIVNSDRNTILVVTNADGAATHTVTVLTPGSSGGVPLEDPVFTVEKSGTAILGPFAPAVFNQSNGQVFINASSAELKFRAIRVP